MYCEKIIAITVAVFVASCVVLGIAISRIATNHVAESGIKSVVPVEVTAPPSPEELATPHLQNADEACEALIASHEKSIDQFFTAAKANTRPFAKTTLGWRSKWLLIKDKLSRGSNKHEIFLRDQFAKHLFAQSDLEKMMTQLTRSFLNHVNSIESQMLVDLRSDVAEFSATYPMANFDDEKLQAVFSDIYSQVAQTVGKKLPTEISGEVVRFIVAEVLTHVAIKLGVSGGILSIGAGSSIATAGAGLVAGIIVDQIVSLVWNWVADPEGKLSKELNKQLDQLAASLKADLRSYLSSFLKQRSELRSQTLMTLLEQ